MGSNISYMYDFDMYNKYENEKKLKRLNYYSDSDSFDYNHYIDNNININNYNDDNNNDNNDSELGSSVCLNGFDNFDSFDNFDNFNHYKLYIYIDPVVSSTIKTMYKENAEKNNTQVDLYLTSSNNNNNNNNNNDICFDAGFDIICPEDLISYGTHSLLVDYQIKCCMTMNNKYVGYYLYSRSSTPLKTPLRLANSVGIIDSGYRGNIKALFDNNSNFEFTEYNLNAGDRYLQICPPNLQYPIKVYIVDTIQELGKETLRGTGGFGSTGK